MAAKGITVSGGVIDSGYTGELIVVLTNHLPTPFEIKAGDKIVQMIPAKVYTENGVVELLELPESGRAATGFGSTGQ